MTGIEQKDAEKDGSRRSQQSDFFMLVGWSQVPGMTPTTRISALVSCVLTLTIMWETLGFAFVPKVLLEL